MANAVRVGIIGTGFGATVVAPAFAATGGCEVVDIVTPRDEQAVRRLCARQDVDLISVHSPPFLHQDHVDQAIDAGHAVLCDKPFGLNADQSAQMFDWAQSAGVVNLLNFERRYDPVRQQLQSLIDEGAIGTPDHFQYSRFTAMPQPLAYGWLSQKELGGGWLAGQGSHLIDACRWLFGEVEAATAMTRTIVPERLDRDGKQHACDAEDGFTAILRSSSGVTAVIDCALDCSVTIPERMAVFGSTGLLEITGPAVVQRSRSGEVISHDVDMQGKTPLVSAMERWAGVVCDAVRSGAVPEGAPTFADGLACARIMDSVGRNSALK
jgi:predicted dehydrogenase